ncbi:restriction endonuclease [Aerococcus urinaeequi]|uniref:restriction endonuclease n=1 Tax=Aerococcus urinaeequi TaxID=51665 RepID=UPI003D6B508C
MITRNDIAIFLNSHDYDIRKTNNGRWLDQKVTYDVASMIADCVLDYYLNNGNVEFTANDIWHSEFASINILAIFNKPSLTEERMKNEYDKFFSQPLLFLASSGVLKLDKRGTRNFFSIENIDMLEYIASRDRNAYIFTEMYIEKVMTDSDLWQYFEAFFSEQSSEAYYALKDKFSDFMRTHTPINGKLEPNRIFTKVLNPLAVKRRKLGTRRGRISKSTISMSELRYNQENFRDLNSKKPKDISRQAWLVELKSSLNNSRTSYQISKAKSFMRKFNDTYRSSLSEHDDEWGNAKATHIHHIFPAYEFPELSDTIENLMALTPTQHLNKAHPDSQTSRINTDYQKKLLLSKIDNIEANIMGAVGDEPIYDFIQLVNVLETGFDTDLNVNYGDFDFLRSFIHKIYK